MRRSTSRFTALALALSVLLSTRGAFGQAAPSSAPPPPPTAAPEVRVQFAADAPGVTLLRPSGAVPVTRFGGWRHVHWIEQGLAPAWSPICTAPCATSVPSGTQRLALAKDGGPPVVAEETLTIRAPATIHGHYVDRSSERAAGAVVGIGGGLVGAILTLASVRAEDVCDVAGDCYRRELVDGPMMVTGIGVLVGSVIAGSVLAAERDEAHVTIEPFVASSLPARREGSTWISGPAPEGATLTIRF